MKRPFAEWLLLPLFLLPLAAGAGFLLYARHDYRSALAPYREDGARRLAAQLADGGEWFVRGFEDRFAATSGSGARVTTPQGELQVEAAGIGGEWVLGYGRPTGLTAAALADPEVRLAVERGAPGALAAPPDPVTQAFLDLFAAPDPEALRSAPLPAATKLFLHRRAGGDAATERFLTALVAWHAHGAWPPGEHTLPGYRLFAFGGRRPDRLVARENLTPGGPITREAVRGDGLVFLDYAPGRGVRPPGEILFAARRETPLAGEWRFRAPHADRWWEGPVFRRYAGLAAGAALGLLLLPTALLFVMRRRRKLDEARARFLTELAHDLRTPLTSLRLYAELLTSGKAPEEDLPEYLETIGRESARLSALLANLLDLSRLERGGRGIDVEILDLDEVVETAVRDFAALYPDRADDVRVSGPDDLAVRADRVALGRCLANLLDNAGKFTPSGTTIRVAFEPGRDGAVLLRVEDEGPGVPDSERARLFDRYARGAAAKRDGVPGTGLGLSLVRELCETMGGTVRLLDRERGAAFEMSLPGGGDD